MPVTKLTTQPQAYPAICSLWSWNRNSTNHAPHLPESSMLGSASRWCKRRGERLQSGDEIALSYLSPVGFLSATNSLESCFFTLATTVPSNAEDESRFQISVKLGKLSSLSSTPKAETQDQPGISPLQRSKDQLWESCLWCLKGLIIPIFFPVFLSPRSGHCFLQLPL